MCLLRTISRLIMRIAEIINNAIDEVGQNKDDPRVRHSAHYALVCGFANRLPHSPWNMKHVLEEFDVIDPLIVTSMTRFIREQLILTSETLR